MSKKRHYKTIWKYAHMIWGSEAREALHDIIDDDYGLDSLTKLSWVQYFDLEDRLFSMLYPKGASVKQLEVLRKIRKQINNDPARFSGLLKKQTGKTKLEDLSRAEVTKVITGFNRMEKSKQLTEKS